MRRIRGLPYWYSPGSPGGWQMQGHSPGRGNIDIYRRRRTEHIVEQMTRSSSSWHYLFWLKINVLLDIPCPVTHSGEFVDNLYKKSKQVYVNLHLMSLFISSINSGSNGNCNYVG